MAEAGDIQMGLALRKAMFSLHPESAHITHGSWGTVPKPVYEKQMYYNRLMESEPDRFFRKYVGPLLLKNEEIAAKYLGADPKNLVLVENTTAAINTAVKCLPLKKGDGILVYSWTYKSIENACRAAAHYAGAEVVTLELCTPISSQQEVIDKYRKCLDENPHIKVAVLEYISSPTATMFPIKELIELCRSRDVITVIDGAHSPGQVPVHLETMGCDFFAGNLHKWMFTPRGCAVFWVSPQFQSITRPLVTSGNFMSKDWRQDFIYQGTRDYTPYIVAEEALKFYSSLGGMQALQAYTDDLLEKAVAHMVEQFGTQRFPIPKDMEAPYMRVVELPNCDKYVPANITGVFADMDLLMDDLWDKFKAEVTALYIHGRPWIRLSCYAYNHLDDYVRITQAIKTLYAQR